MLNLIRVGAFDGFGEPRTAQFWQVQYLAQWPHAQGFLFKSDENSPLPAVPLTEPDRPQRLHTRRIPLLAILPVPRRERFQYLPEPFVAFRRMT